MNRLGRMGPLLDHCFLVFKITKSAGEPDSLIFFLRFCAPYATLCLGIIKCYPLSRDHLIARWSNCRDQGGEELQRARVLGIVLFLVGLWVFLAPFTGPAMHMAYAQTATSSGMMHMGAGMMANAVVVNQAIVFFNFVPGVILIMLGLYYSFNGQTRVTP